jgi:iron(III) transport system substrate-binding protein
MTSWTFRARFPRLVALALSALTLGSLLSSCGQPTAEGEKLTIYSGRSEEFIAPFLEQFTAETGIEFDVRYGDSAALAAQLLEEGENSPADIFLSQDAGSLGAVSGAQLLAQLPNQILSRVESKYQSPTSDWVGVTGIAPTNGSFQTFVTALIQARGEAAAERWLAAIKANQPVLYEKNSQIMEAIDSGQIDIGLVNHYYLWEVAEELGRDINVKIDFFQAGDLGNLVNAAGAGILSTSQKKDSAQSLIDFLLRDDIQQKFVRDTHEYSLVLPSLWPEGLPALVEVASPAVDLASLSDLRRTQELLIKVGLI